MFNNNTPAVNKFSAAKKCGAAIAMLVASLWAIPAVAADVEAGAKVFKDACSKCHSVSKPMSSKKAPSLLGIMGRSSSRIAGYKYSEAMLAANLTWTEEKLESFLINPKQVVPNNKMKFKGMAKAEDRANLIEFLQLQQ